MIGRSKELEDVGRVASSFSTYLGKIEATLLAGYPFVLVNKKMSEDSLVNCFWENLSFYQFILVFNCDLR